MMMILHTTTTTFNLVTLLLLLSFCISYGRITEEERTTETTKTIRRPSKEDEVSHLSPDKNLQECQHSKENNDPFGKYHLDTTCNRIEFNRYRESYERYANYKRIQSMGTTDRIPNAQTVFCPSIVRSLREERKSSSSGSSMYGFDSLWIVENSASVPIVVAYVNEEGMEFSARDPTIAPPHKDPHAILQPGQWKPVFSYEGQVFHIREVLDDGRTLGNVLVQHRMGLIPITNKYGGPPVSCDPNEPDLEPLNEEDVIDPDYARSPAVYGRQCHVMDVGFRNEVGCPIHGYYSGIQGANTTTGEASCQELFKFHLGMNRHAKDFMFDWESHIKYEDTFMGHTFVFRLASNPSILIDQVTIQPTMIPDCPNLKQREFIQSNMIVTPLGTLQMLTVPNPTTNHTTITTTTNNTSTRSTRTNRSIGSSNNNNHNGPSLSYNFTGTTSSSNLARYWSGSTL